MVPETGSLLGTVCGVSVLESGQIVLLLTEDRAHLARGLRAQLQRNLSCVLVSTFAFLPEGVRSHKCSEDESRFKKL